MLLEWTSSPRNDSICDSLCMLILQVGEWATPQLVKMIEAVGGGRQKQEYMLALQSAIEGKFVRVEPRPQTSASCLRIYGGSDDVWQDFDLEMDQVIATSNSIEDTATEQLQEITETL